MARPKGKRYDSDSRRWFRLDSEELAARTADLTDAEFRAFILILAWANENKAHERGDAIVIAKSQLLSVSPNGRHSVAKSARVVRELSSKQSWEVRELPSKWVISIKKYSQKQGFSPATTPTPTPTPTTTTTTTREDVADAPDVVVDDSVSEPKGEDGKGFALNGSPPPEPEESPPKKSRKKPSVLMPESDEWPEGDLEKIHGYVEKDLKRQVSMDEFHHGMKIIQAWAMSDEVKRKNWVQACRGYFLDGWALKGYKTPAKTAFEIEMKNSPFNETEETK